MMQNALGQDLMHDKPVALQKVYGTISYRNEGEPENEDSWRDRPIAIYLDFTKLNYCEDNGGEVSDVIDLPINSYDDNSLNDIGDYVETNDD